MIPAANVWMQAYLASLSGMCSGLGQQNSNAVQAICLQAAMFADSSLELFTLRFNHKTQDSNFILDGIVNCCHLKCNKLFSEHGNSFVVYEGLKFCNPECIQGFNEDKSRAVHSENSSATG